MEFGPLSSREAISKRFNQMRIESRQEILSKIYGSDHLKYNESTIEKDITDAFCMILNNQDFSNASQPAKQISHIFNINLQNFGKMDPKQRQKLLYDKIYAKVQDSLKIIDKKGEEDHNKSGLSTNEQLSNHFQWLGIQTNYTQLRPIFQQILLEKVKLFDNQLTSIADHLSQAPLNTLTTISKTASTFDLPSTTKRTDLSRLDLSKTKIVQNSQKAKRVQSCIERQFCNVKIRDKSEFLLDKWTEQQQSQFLSKKAVFRSNLKINNIPVLFQFVKKYTSTVKARDHIYRKWQEREKYGITPDELKYLCATSLFLNNTLAPSQKMRIRDNVRAAGHTLISKLELNIAQKIIQTYHQLMKRVADLRGKYYEERTQNRKKEQQIGSRRQKSKQKITKNRQIFLRYKQIFTRIVNGQKMRIILNPKIYKWVILFIANIKKRLQKPNKHGGNDTVFKRLNNSNTSTLLVRTKMKFPSSKIIKREDSHSHRLKYHTYIPSEHFQYDPTLQKMIKENNKIKLSSAHSSKFYQQITGGPKNLFHSIRVDLTRKKIAMSSPKCLKFIIIIQAKWRAIYQRKKYKARLDLLKEQRQAQFQQQVSSLRRLYPVGRRINMKVIQNRLKRTSKQFANMLRPYVRVNRRPINHFTSFHTSKLPLAELKTKYSRNGQIRIAQFTKLVHSNQFSMLKKSGIVITSKQINEIEIARGANAMWWAVRNSCTELVKILLEGGGDPNSKDQDHNSCLHVAIKNGCIEIVFLLLDYGADLNAKNSKKVTPLFFARGKMLKLLGLEQGCVEGEKDNNSIYFKGSHWSDDVYHQHHY